MCDFDLNLWYDGLILGVKGDAKRIPPYKPFVVRQKNCLRTNKVESFEGVRARMSKRQKRISVGLKESDYEKIRELADEKGISYSKYIGNIVRGYLVNNEKIDEAIFDIQVNNEVVESVNFDKKIKEIIDFNHPDFINNVVELALKKAMKENNYKGVF